MTEQADNTILVTGASRGIGKGIALGLAAQGHTIVVHYVRDEEGATATLGAIQDTGGTGRLLRFDVSDRNGRGDARG